MVSRFASTHAWPRRSQGRAWRVEQRRQRPSRRSKAGITAARRQKCGRMDLPPVLALPAPRLPRFAQADRRATRASPQARASFPPIIHTTGAQSLLIDIIRLHELMFLSIVDAPGNAAGLSRDVRAHVRQARAPHRRTAIPSRLTWKPAKQNQRPVQNQECYGRKARPACPW